MCVCVFSRMGLRSRERFKLLLYLFGWSVQIPIPLQASSLLSSSLSISRSPQSSNSDGTCRRHSEALVIGFCAYLCDCDRSFLLG